MGIKDGNLVTACDIAAYALLAFKVVRAWEIARSSMIQWSPWTVTQETWVLFLTLPMTCSGPLYKSLPSSVPLFSLLSPGIVNSSGQGLSLNMCIFNAQHNEAWLEPLSITAMYTINDQPNKTPWMLTLWTRGKFSKVPKSLNSLSH